MKKIVVSLVVFILFIGNIGNIYAAKYDNIGLTIDLPEDYYDLKDGIDKDDAKVLFYTALMKTTKEELIKEYEQNLTLYNGINSDLSKEIFITMSENSITKNVFHLTLASENELTQVKNELNNAIKSQGMTVTKQEMYQVGGVTFVYTIIKDADVMIYQYYTIVNGIGITFSQNNSDATSKDEELKKIVGSVSFDELQEKPVKFTMYILIGITAILVIMVIVLMFMAFSRKKEDNFKNFYDENQDEDEN